MRTRKGFRLRTVCGENILVAEGIENIDFSRIISMNESSAYLWNKVQEMGEFSVADMARLLCDEYEVDEDTATADAKALAAKWTEAGIVE